MLDKVEADLWKHHYLLLNAIVAIVGWKTIYEFN